MFTAENDVTCAEFDIRRLCLHSPAKGEAMACFGMSQLASTPVMV